MYYHSMLRLSLLLLGFSPYLAMGDPTFSPSLFWEERIETALSRRNAIFRDLLPESADLDMTAWNSILRRTVESVIFNRESVDATWDPFIRGLLFSLQGNPAAQTEFAAALSAAVNDPGATWLLFVEFDRYNQEQWVEKALLQLEKQMFQEGASTAIIISRQLMHYGFMNKMRHSIEKAHYYFIWAHRFNAHEVTSIIQRAITTPPLHFIRIGAILSELITPLRLSWKVQFDLFYLIYKLMRRAVFFFILFVILTLGIKHFPMALHRCAHLYPYNVAISLRTLLVSAVAASFSAFGVIAFLWLVAFLVWGCLSSRERLLFRVALAGVVLSPLDSAVMDRINNTLNPAGATTLLFRSINEGPPQKTAMAHATGGETNLPLEMSMVVDAVKNFDFGEANRRINTLLDAYPNDPFIINLKGIIHFLTGSIDSAAFCFKRVVQSNPSDFTAQFNLSRCSVALGDATAGLDQLKKAAQLQPNLVNRFVQDNDRCFSDQWPPLRQVLFPFITPVRFWIKLFLPPVRHGSIGRQLWGVSFFGIPPVASFVIFLLLFLALIAMEWFNGTQHRVRRMFECKYCGRIICRQCSSGVICGSCNDRIHSLNISRTIEQTREMIISRSSLLHALRAAWFNTVFPGTGSLLEKRARYVSAIRGIAASSIVYAFWYSIFDGCPFKWLTPAEIAYIVLLPLLFHLCAVVRYAPSAIRQSSSLFHLYFSKERNTDGTKRNVA